MKHVKAYMKMFDYLGVGKSEKYLAFLKKHFKESNPNFYSVAAKRRVNTEDGIMYAVRLDIEIADPTLEPIAESWINGHYFYLWRDLCWCIAIDEDGRDLAHSVQGYIGEAVGRISVNPKSKPCNKTLIIHPIGRDPVFENENE